jgi:hypothetical protein
MKGFFDTQIRKIIRLIDRQLRRLQESEIYSSERIVSINSYHTPALRLAHIPDSPRSFYLVDWEIRRMSKERSSLAIVIK